MLDVEYRRAVGFAAVTTIGAVGLTTIVMGVGENTPTGACPSATITALPYCDDGDTTCLDCTGAPITNGFDDTCPYSGSTSPEVFYTITPTAEMDAADGSVDGTANLDIDACDTFYDNKIYVFDAGDLVNTIACVDDACTNSAGDGFRARVLNIALTVDTTYYIAIDGWGGQAGRYQLFVDVTGGPGCTLKEPIGCICLGDLNINGRVDFPDLTRLLAAWGCTGACPEDLDGDGQVAFGDLTTFLPLWGDCS